MTRTKDVGKEMNMHGFYQTQRTKGYIVRLISLWLSCVGLFWASADRVEHSTQPVRVKPSATLAAKPFPLNRVQLLPGPFLDSQKVGEEYLLSLDVDRLLAGFRKEAGLPVKVKPYGGWERTQVAGHSLGHYLSAISIAYAVTGKEEFLERARYIVQQLAICQKAHGDGYVGASPGCKQRLSQIAMGQIESAPFRLNGIWSPFYTIHKIMAGLRDAYRLCGIKEALEVEKGLADWIWRILQPITEEQMQKVLVCEYGGMNEVLADLYADTGNPRYLYLARRFYDRAVLDPMVDGIDVLPGRHVNTQVPKLVGLATIFELTGNDRFRRAAEFFWDRVVHHHCYVTGGVGDREYFGPPDHLSNRLSRDTTETCPVYNMLKLTFHLFGWRPTAEVADYYERALLNHILATHHPDGRVIYNLTLQPGGFKVYQTKYNSFTCCVGTGMENHVRYGEAIYFHDDNGLWINLYIASRLSWPEKGLELVQETGFPFEQQSRLTLRLRRPVSLELRFRIPHWVREGFAVELNGSPVSGERTRTGYYLVRRVWKDGDRLTVRFPMSLRLERMPDDPRMIAIFYGPTLLAADLGPVDDPKASDPLYVPDLVTHGKKVSEWVQTVDKQKLIFRTEGVGRPRDVTLVPFWKLHDRRYSVFFKLLSEQQWAEKYREIQAIREAQRRLDARTVDMVKIGDPASEKAHALRGERTDSGEAHGRRWRHATGGGWFEYELKVRPEEPMELMCTYWGSDSGNRVFDILVDGRRIATQRLQNERPGRFFDRVYPIPEEITQGKEKVVVRFQAHKNAWAGGVFGLRMLIREEAEAKATTSQRSEGDVPADLKAVSDYLLQPVPFWQVKLTDGFWKKRCDTNRVATIWHCLEECEKTGRIDNFRVAAGLKEGAFRGLYFNDSDVYKVMEAMAYVLKTHPDPKLESKLEELVKLVAAAQQPDGYIYTPRIIKKGPRPPGGWDRWSSIMAAHELYCMGHMIEAAVAHYQATGRDTFLNVARKAADLICKEFNEKGRREPPGHQEIEIALVKLYRVTGDPKYLRQAYFFLEQRGRPETHRLYGGYSQDHLPVREQTTSVGHAVRAAYMYSAMADIAALLNERGYFRALEKIWQDVVGTKLYITGGIGAAGGHEGFAGPYELPNLVAYCETCAGIANVLWNYRMYLLTGDAKYIDVLERTLYNNVLDGVSLDGTRFFYPNPLESDGRHARSPWFGCACCPPNVARLLPQVPGFVYATRPGRLYVALYMASKATVKVDGQQVKIEQQTQYPWDGKVTLVLHPEKDGQRFALLLRIPGWARNQAIPSDLYWFADNPKGKVTIKVNGRPVPLRFRKGFAVIRRVWKKEDRVELRLPMSVRRVLAHPNVQADRGRVALQRGPIVYCVEWPDVEGGSVASLVLPDGAQIIDKYEPDLLNGVVTLHMQAVRLSRTSSGNGLERTYLDIKAIPYYAWAHRGKGEMAVWLAREEWAARPLPAPTIASKATAKASGGNVRALNDQREPRSSNDHSNPYLHWWPRKGTVEWVEYHFDQPYRVYGVEVYWFDDTGRGECRVPESWRLFYRRDGKWIPVPNPSGFGCEKDRYNKTTFDAVITDALRLEVKLQPRWSAGIHEWKVLGEPVKKSSSARQGVQIRPGVNLIQNASFEEGQGNRPVGWRPTRWNGSGKFTYAKIGRTGTHSVAISSDQGGDLSWTTFVPIEPFARYRLAGWIKTENLDPGTGRGALLNIHNLQGVATPAITGTHDWTRVEVEFEVADLDQLQINCLFGGWGRSTGKAWFDDIELVLLEKKDVTKPSIRINASEEGSPISPFVYGQFIEHLGRCIYGGIWAELVQDRKFFYPVGDKRSPWQPIGSRSAVQMTQFQPFVGEQDVLLQPRGNSPVGIRQSHLGLKAGMDYIGRIWVNGLPGIVVSVTLKWGPLPEQSQTNRFVIQQEGYYLYPLHFIAGRTTKEGELFIAATGYGAIRIGAVSLMPADALLGMRWDTLELLRQLNAPIYRWPGGNFVSGYDWRDGIGDPDRRPPKKNPAWQGIEPNDFGIDEFIQFCRTLDAEPYIVVNSGLGNVEMAVQEVEYANGGPDTPMGRKRAENGHPEPYGVRYWGIGNEMYGSWQLGHMPVEQYAKKHNQFAEAMRRKDPKIILIGVGAVGRWDEVMLRNCADHMDFISEHFYRGEQPGLYSHVRQIPDSIRRIVEAHRRYRKEIPQLHGKEIRIAMDEWNYWYGPYVFGELGTRYFLKDALGIAAGLHEYARQSDMIAMANYAQTVNVIGCIKTSSLNAAFETTGLVLKMYRRHFGSIPVRTETQGLIDAQAAWSADRKYLTLGIVNPSLQKVTIPIEVHGAQLTGKGIRWEISGADPKAYNDPDHASQVVIRQIPFEGLTDHVSVPPCSVTLLRLEVKK